MATLDDLRKGMKLEVDGRPYVVIEFQHVNAGEGPVSVRTKLKELGSREVIDKTFDTDSKIKDADVEERQLQYVYQEGGDFVFMDAASGEQLTVGSTIVGDAAKYLSDGSQANVTLYKGNPLENAIAARVELVIVETEPPTQGDGTKPATGDRGRDQSPAVPGHRRQGQGRHPRRSLPRPGQIAAAAARAHPAMSRACGLTCML